MLFIIILLLLFIVYCFCGSAAVTFQPVLLFIASVLLLWLQTSRMEWNVRLNSVLFFFFSNLIFFNLDFERAFK